MTENAIARIEGKVVGITDRGVDAKGRRQVKIDLEVPGSKFNRPLWTHPNDEGSVIAKGGAKLKVNDYIVVDYYESKYISKQTGQETVSRWAAGEIEVVDEETFKSKPKPPETLGDYPSMEESLGGFKPASEIKPLDVVVAERVKIMETYRAALREAMQRELKGEECGWLSTLFIDHMKEVRIQRKYGGDL